MSLIFEITYILFLYVSTTSKNAVDEQLCAWQPDTVNILLSTSIGEVTF